MTFCKEVALVTYKNFIVSVDLGDLNSVEFDFLSIWDFIKKKKNFQKEYLNFFHSHAPACDFCSTTDINCIKGLTLAFGYSINFWILSLETCLKKYRLEKDEVKCVRSIDIKDFRSSVIDEYFDVRMINSILSLISMKVGK